MEFESTKEKSKAILAEHALVIMFVPLIYNWVQPIASFATRSTAPSVEFAKIVVESVLQLERHGASALAVMSDCAETTDECGCVLEYRESCISL